MTQVWLEGKCVNSLIVTHHYYFFTFVCILKESENKHKETQTVGVCAGEGCEYNPRLVNELELCLLRVRYQARS